MSSECWVDLVFGPPPEPEVIDDEPGLIYRCNPPSGCGREVHMLGQPGRCQLRLEFDRSGKTTPAAEESIFGPEIRHGFIEFKKGPLQG